jgi:dCTP deaminase
MRSCDLHRPRDPDRDPEPPEVGVHITAPTIHAGFAGQIQLEIKHQGTVPVRLLPGVKVRQLIFEQTLGVANKGYAGIFLGQAAH